ncbi:MAG: EAL domain-containing protein [Azonexus sp.]|jgi:diguanylate cyclase (GGDEF)-like protein/PAS domain S-box-containing protein|nr:EAL domain-containing protein [Azonexus sp.]
MTEFNWTSRCPLLLALIGALLATVLLTGLQWLAFAASPSGASRILDGADILRLALPTLVLFILVALLSRLAVRRLTAHHLRTLRNTVTETFKDGEINAAGLARMAEIVNEAAKDEIGEIYQTLGRVASEIGRRQESQRIASMVIKHSRDSIIVSDREMRILEANPATTDFYGYDPAELVGKNFLILCPPELTEDFWHQAREQIKTTGQWQGETLNPRKKAREGEARREQGRDYRPVWTRVTALRDASGRVSHFVGISTDLTERKEAEKRLRHMALFDTLTGLPNRRMLLEQLQLAIQQAHPHRRKLSLIVLDIDRFRGINDSIGVHQGDELLQVVARRLQGMKIEEEVAARLSSDEFAVLLPGGDANQAARRARQLLEQLCGAYHLEKQSVPLAITLTAGISVFPDDTESGDNLLSQAITAASHNKEANERKGLHFFTPQMSTRIHERFVLEADLGKALASGGQFFLAYQPQFDVVTRQVVGVEALIRWQHPERGLVSPAQFIPFAEESSLILDIGDWVLKEAARQGAMWQRMGLNLRVAVNLSARQFSQSRLPAQIAAALDSTNLAPHLLELEITESALMNDVEQAIEHLASLSQRGIQIALDDFGTGYSSLSYLQRFALNRLKIDQSFVCDLGNQDAMMIVNAIINLAHSLGMEAIAEGVETAAQLDSLVNMKCDEYQGYYGSRPAPAEAIPDIIARQRTMSKE